MPPGPPAGPHGPAESAIGAPRRRAGLLPLWLALGWAGYALLPWYAPGAPGGGGSGIQLALFGGRSWLLPLLPALALPIVATGRRAAQPWAPAVLTGAGAAGLGWLALQGFALTQRGWAWPALGEAFGAAAATQGGMGAGAALTAGALLMLVAHGRAARGALRGDRFAAGALALIVALVALFIAVPVGRVLVGALQAPGGALALDVFASRLGDARLWRLDCASGAGYCGAAWNTLGLALATASGTTLLGLACALVVTRTGFPARRALRALTILPIITPPFVVSLALILLFGRSGTVTRAAAELLGVDGGRWIYGFGGVWLAQMLAFTPVAFLVLIGVVENVSPALEEAAATLRASRARVFATVSLPLMRPGLAAAFLLGFIESMADFGNPLILGGGFQVLSTEIFFAVVGARHEPGRAATLALVLLGFTLLAFAAQRRWLGAHGYTSIAGRGDRGGAAPLPGALRGALFAVTVPWALFTAAVYALIVFGGFVHVWGLDHGFTLRHYAEAFGVTRGPFGLVWSGGAWPSFFTTLRVALLAALPTALLGLLTAWLLGRQSFAGKAAFEFGTMASFAVPGTVIGVAYIVTFNVPPIEITGTALILLLAFVFRNLPVGVRAGLAGLAQIDRSLDEASLVHRASSLQTVRFVLLPLLRPALLAALVYSFVSAMTAISAVIFLVSARHELATTYILNRVEAGSYGSAVAYSSVLIVVILLIVLAFERLVGTRGTARGMVPAGEAGRTPP